MARHVVSVNALAGSARSLARFASQYPEDAKISFHMESGDDGEMHLFYAIEFDEFAKTMKDAEIERSWRENPDRMGGCFTDQEIAASGRDGYGWY